MPVQFAQKFRPGSSSMLPAMSVADVMSRLGGAFNNYQWLADPTNQSVDAFLGSAMLSFDPSGNVRDGIDPVMANAIRGTGLQGKQMAQILQQRQALASGATQAFMSPDGKVQMVSRGDPGWGTDLGARIFAPGSGAFNPVEGLLNGQMGGGYPPQQGAAPGTNGYNTADMVRDPTSGEMIPRSAYVQRYSQPRVSGSGRPMGREGSGNQRTGGTGTPVGPTNPKMGGGPRSPFGQTSFGGGFGGKQNAYSGFGNPAGRSRYERKA